MTDKLDIVYGMCVHGNNMASCQECKDFMLPPIGDPDLVEMKNSFCQCTVSRQTPKINDVYVCVICNKPTTI